MNAAQQAQFQQLLGEHDRVRRSTEMPLWYGDKMKDSCSALYIVDRLENAKRIGNWPDDERVCNEFYAILRGKALIWWGSLKDHNVDLKVWAQVKKAFLKAYEPKYSPKLTVTNFSELVQKNNEGVHDFYLRISEVCRKMFRGRPDALFDIRHDYPKAPAANAYDPDIVKAIKLEGLEDDEMYIKHQIFIAGIKEELRCKVIEENKATLGESVYFAIELEAILNERKLNLKLNAVEEVNDESLTEEEKNMINALRFKRNGGGGGKFQKRMPPKPTATTVCRYCKKTGHFQKECRSRIRDKAPMVDVNGKPFQKRVNPINEEGEENHNDWEEEPKVIGSISGGVQSLNWD